MDYTARQGSAPCPNPEHPLHHFVHSAWREDTAKNAELGSNPEWKGETYAFECSSHTCSAVVVVHLKPPRLPPEMVDVLTDQIMLKARIEEAFKVGAGRLEGMKHPSSVEVMGDLRTYIRNSWIPDKSRPITLNNKRFMLRFGPDGQACKDLLEYVGFTLEVCCCVL